MLTFWTHLWKEWRDHRKAVGFICIAVPVVALILAFTNAPYAVTGELPEKVTVGTLILVAAVLCAEMYTREHQTGSIQMLRRLPAGLPAAFVCKLVFLLLSTAACAAVALIVCEWAGMFLAQGTVLPEGEVVLWQRIGNLFAGRSLYVAGGLVMVHITLAASCWIHRGLLALPLAGIVLALAALPLWGLFSYCGTLAFLKPHQTWLSVALIGASVWVAWSACVKGQARAGQRAASLRAALTALGVSSLVFHGWAFYIGHRWTHHVDPHDESFYIWDGFIGRNNQLFVTSHMFMPGWLTGEWPVDWTDDVERRTSPGPSHCLRVDLGTGHYERIGPPGAWMTSAVDTFFGVEAHPPGQLALFLVLPATGSEEAMVCRLDTDTGALGRPTGWSDAMAFLVKNKAEVLRQFALRLPDGRQAYTIDHTVYIHQRDGRIHHYKLPRPHGRTPGFGIHVSSRQVDCPEVFDLLREKRLASPKGTHPYAVLPAGWLVGTYSASARHLPTHWSLCDPETGACVPAPGIGTGDSFWGVLDDNRVLIARDGQPNHELVAVDISTGNRHPVQIPLPDPRTGRTAPALGNHPPHFVAWQQTPRGRLLLRGGRYVTRLDPHSLEATVPVVCARVLGCLDEDHVLTLSKDHRRVERVNLVSGDREILFPR